jgi:hypothetical protein
MASIAWAIKMPTLKTIKKMSNQVLTATSRLGSEPSCLCTVKGIAQGTAISAAAEDSLPHGAAIVGTRGKGVSRRRRSQEVETKCLALQGLRLTASDSMRAALIILLVFAILHSSKEVAATRNE